MEPQPQSVNADNAKKRKSTEMQSSSEKEPKTEFKYDLPTPSCFKQLVNNEHLADIRFKFSDSEETIYAHKLIITTKSEVFYTQFLGSFAESQRDTLKDPVVITDIKPEPFLELLRFIYCGEASIRPDNLLDMFYAADKYMLESLRRLCRGKFEELINEETVLDVFQHNRRYEFPSVDTICLKIICDNPLKYFKQEKFQTLSQKALQLIAGSGSMNCTVEQLDDAIEQWQKCNGKSSIENLWQSVLCRKLYFQDKCAYRANIDTSFALRSTNSQFALYGVGIYIGVENDARVPDLKVTVSVDVNGVCSTKEYCVLDELSICEIMFEKRLINQTCSVSVKVVQSGAEYLYKMFHRIGWSKMPSDNLTIYENSATRYSASNALCYNYSQNRTPINCVAYLMCSRS